MPFRIIEGSEVQSTRSSHVLRDGEIAIDGNSLYVGDGSTAGGTQIGGSSSSAEQSFKIKTTDFDAESGERYGINTSSNTVTATLPATPTIGDAIHFADAVGNYATNKLTLGRNGNTIMGLTEDMDVTTNNQSFGVFYNGNTWRTY